MNAIVRDETVREIKANIGSPSEVEDPVRRARQVDQPVLRVSEGHADDKPIAPSPVKSTPPLRTDGSRTGRLLVRRLATIGIAAVAVGAAIVTWDQYNAGPWTRDGRLRVQVASVAPEISGRIKELRVVDNQFVHKGDVLYVVDPFDFDVALRSNKAVLQQRIADLSVKDLQSERRRRL